MNICSSCSWRLHFLRQWSLLNSRGIHLSGCPISWGHLSLRNSLPTVTQDFFGPEQCGDSLGIGDLAVAHGKQSLIETQRQQIEKLTMIELLIRFTLQTTRKENFNAFAGISYTRVCHAQITPIACTMPRLLKQFTLRCIFYVFPWINFACGKS